MGDANPVVAQQLSPNSLRALYGASLVQNAVMGSPDYESAELQIASLFASSPPYPVTDLPDVTPGGSMRSMNSSFLQKLQHSANSENGGYAASSGTNPSTLGGQNRRLSFKARIIPTSHTKPDIVPRTTRAASLRAGVAVEKVPSVARAPPTKEAIARTFANVPGHKRTGTITVASTAPPVVAPRMTRAASLRLGQPLTPKPIRTTTSDGAAAGRPGLAALTLEKKSTGFDGVPGHKRRETFSVASTKTPTVAPRTNRSAALRLQKDNAPPSSWGGEFNVSTYLTKTNYFLARPPQSLSRSTSATSLNGSTARTPSRPSSVSSIRPTPALRTPSRDTAPQARPTPVVYGSESLTPEKPKPRTSTASAPSIVPRTNKSAALRAAKMALASSTNTNGKPPATRRISTFF